MKAKLIIAIEGVDEVGGCPISMLAEMVSVDIDDDPSEDGFVEKICNLLIMHLQKGNTNLN